MSIDHLSLDEAKERLDVATLWRVFNFPGQPSKSCRCPMHDDRSASFSVYSGTQGGLRWRCFAGCGGGGPVELVARALDLSDREACRWLLDQAGGEGSSGVTIAAPTRPAPVAETVRRFKLPTGLHRGSHADMATVASLRGLSVAGVKLACERGLLWFGSSCGFPAWIVTDSARVNAQSRRLDGKVFPLFKELTERKAHTIGGSRAAWPIGTREAQPMPFVVVVEGGPDLIAAHALIVAEGREADTAAVAMLGATPPLPTDALSVLTQKRIRLFPHADPPGQEAAIRWAEQLENVGCVVDAFRFDGLRRSDGAQVNDLNDFVRLDADCFEAERADLARERNTLCAALRQAWDGHRLSALTKHDAMTATDPHISVIGHITREELRQLLTATDSANGFGNRFLWVAVKRSKYLPEGGDLPATDLKESLDWLRKIKVMASKGGELRRDDEARAMWAEVYPTLSDAKPGLFGSVTSRAEAHVLRLSSLYAVLDGTQKVQVPHLHAALALWDYCERSAKWIFGAATGNRDADDILAALRASGSRGLTATQISVDVFQRHRSSEQINRALSTLSLNKLATCQENRQTGGAPSLRWYFGENAPADPSDTQPAK